MRIAVVNEVSSCAKNPDIMAVLNQTNHEIINAGMSDPAQVPELTYLHTGLLSALLIRLELADLVIGGCGTGQGYVNSVLQYPGMTCALVTEPLDAWLAKRINNPNCISLALNKGYGWAGNVNLELIIRALLEPADAPGYPASRAESQTRSRGLLGEISNTSHYDMVTILENLDPEITGPIYENRVLKEHIHKAPDSELKAYIISHLKG